MDTTNALIKKISLRCLSVFLMLVSILFSLTWKGSFCLGDEVLTSLGVKAWSNGTHGTHYTALCSLVMLLAAFLIFSMTTRKKLVTLRNFLIALTALFILSSLIP